MSRSLNKVMLIGNLGSDPEVRSTTGGNRVASFSLATSRSWTSPNGEKQEKTEWHRCVVWNTKGTGLADVVEKYCKKGDRIYVEGRIEYRQWQDKENQTRYSTEVNVRDRSDAVKTPIDQNENRKDIDITANIRKRVVDTKMSVNAQNVKIITQDGKVTLRGPVKSDEEKAQIEKTAHEVAGAANVDNQLEVQP